MRPPGKVTRTALIAAALVGPVAVVAGAAYVSYAAAGNVYYVAPSGSDTAAGTQAAPWASFAHAQAVAQAGDTVYFRGGTYSYTRANSTCSSGTARVDAITLNKSGTAGNPIRYWAYPGERPVLDFSKMLGVNASGAAVGIGNLRNNIAYAGTLTSNMSGTGATATFGFLADGDGSQPPTATGCTAA